MISLIRRLIVKEWSLFFFSACAILFLLISVANILSGLLRGNVTPSEVFLNHLIDLPNLFIKIFPVASLIASLFSINKLKNRSELSAIFSSGFSRRAFVSTIVVIASFVAILSFFTSGYLQPYLRSKKEFFLDESAGKFRNLSGKGLKASTVGSGRMWFKSDSYYFSFLLFDKSKNILTGVDAYFFNSNYKIATRLSAEIASYKSGNLWELTNGIGITHLDGEDYPAREVFAKKEVILKETPSDFKQLESDITTLRFTDLYAYVKKLKKFKISTAEYEVMLFDKIASSFACILFALIASVGVFNPNRRSSSFGATIFGIFSFTIFYWLVHSYALELGQNNKLHPFIACFGVQILFGVFLSLYFYHHRRLR